MFTNSYSYYYYYSLSLGLSLPLSKTGVSSHNVLIFLSTVVFFFFAIGYSQKRDFYNITVIISFLGLGTDCACSTL